MSIEIVVELDAKHSNIVEHLSLGSGRTLGDMIYLNDFTRSLIHNPKCNYVLSSIDDINLAYITYLYGGLIQVVCLYSTTKMVGIMSHSIESYSDPDLSAVESTILSHIYTKYTKQYQC